DRLSLAVFKHDPIDPAIDSHQIRDQPSAQLDPMPDGDFEDPKARVCLKLKMTSAPPPWKDSSRWAELGAKAPLLVGIILGLVGVINEAYVKELVSRVVPHVLMPDAERALKPLASFRECANGCPEMIVVPAGSFRMGSPATENGHYVDEGPEHRVVFANPIAVSKFPVTFADWDACVSAGGCLQEGRADDVGWGRGTRPVIFVSWDDAQAYLAWLSTITGKPYRLLSEAEQEYAARAGSTTAFSWGQEAGKNNGNCNGCGNQWDNRQTSPVGSFKPNAFGLHDTAGNVWQ